MQITSLFLILAASAHLSRAGDFQIMFCNEKNYQGNCIEVQADWGPCWLIPDSNAKGDQGSSWRITQGKAACTLYTGSEPLFNTCEGRQTAYPGTWEGNPQIADYPGVTYRTFQCSKR